VNPDAIDRDLDQTVDSSTSWAPFYVQSPMPDPQRYRLPISVKAVLVDGGRACLLLNDRDQWELPGGRLERGESPEDCLRREVLEELGLEAEVERLVDARAFEPAPGKEVFVLVYRCRRAAPGDPVISAEHREVGWFSLAEMESLVLPAGYLASLQRAMHPAT
jgi:8-oxo-dGTP pyrophosphatase MutT (NUDIX family)